MGCREGNGTPLQYSCLENPMDGGVWWAAVHGVPKSWTQLSDFTFTHWRRQWQPTPVFLPGESQGRGSLVGCRLWGCTVGHDWSDLAAAAAAAWHGLRNCWAWNDPSSTFTTLKTRSLATLDSLSSITCIFWWSFFSPLSWECPRRTVSCKD